MEAPKELTGVVAHFNSAAAELQKGEFRCPRTPSEWDLMNKAHHARDYGRLLALVVPFIVISARHSTESADRWC